MNKIISFLKESNRYKHLFGGLIVGLLALTPWTAIYASVVAASCLELKDKLRGNYWDWIDWALTVAGGDQNLLPQQKNFPLKKSKKGIKQLKKK